MPPTCALLDELDAAELATFDLLDETAELELVATAELATLDLLELATELATLDLLVLAVELATELTTELELLELAAELIDDVVPVPLVTTTAS